jgi:CRP-like cAMP-binding protein
LYARSGAVTLRVDKQREGRVFGMAQLDRSLIAALPAFASIGPEALDDILTQARPLRAQKGVALFDQGQKAEEFFLLLNGRLRVTRVSPQGQQVVVRFVNPGDMFGVAMAINSPVYPGSATAVVDSLALVWPNAAWSGLISRHPALALNTMGTLGARLQDSQTRILEMSTQQVEKRVAHAILRLANQAGRKTDEGILIDFPISRQDIAEMTGTTLHTVSRILSAWEEKGLVEGGRQRIVVRDPHGLVMLAEDKE